jgi:16S rRNA (guanine527-N7)-methyltransferase
MSVFDQSLFESRVQIGLGELGLPFTALQLSQLTLFSAEFFKWNSIHNLSAIHSNEDYLGAHIMDSLAVIPTILKTVKLGLVPKSAQIADLGVGGGFPGMVLAIFMPEFNYFLVDAVRKKTAFLQHVKGRLQLSNVTVVESRVERFAIESPGSMDATISRAFTELKNFIEYSQPLLKDKGVMFAMKSQKITSELEELPDSHCVLFNDELIIPYLDAYRCILSIQSMRKSNL